MVELQNHVLRNHPSCARSPVFRFYLSLLSMLFRVTGSTSVRKQFTRSVRAFVWSAQTRTGRSRYGSPPLNHPQEASGWVERAGGYAERMRALRGSGHDWLAPPRWSRPQWDPPRDRPLRCLVVSGNWSFLRAPIDALEAGGITVRTLDWELVKTSITSQARRRRKRGLKYSLKTALLARSTFAYSADDHQRALADTVPHGMALVDWADVVFVEWASDAAVWFSLWLPVAKKLVVRCHRYEAFAHWPVFLNHSRVDGLIFIADHIRNAYFIHPLDDNSVHERSRVIHNIRFRPSRFQASNDPLRRFKIGMVMNGSIVKDPLCALAIFERLWRIDERYRLFLVGHDLPLNDRFQMGSRYITDYIRRYRKRLQHLKDHVTVAGFCADLATWFPRIGHLLSCSLSEGSHESVVEGMASGCVPCVRDWPHNAQLGGAASAFPDWPTFSTPDEAVDMILNHTVNFDERSDRAESVAIERYFSDKPRRDLCSFVSAPVAPR